MSLRRLAKLIQSPCARLNLSASLVQANNRNSPILGKDNNGVCVNRLPEQGFINAYICKVGMPPSHPLIVSFDPLEWVNYLKPSGGRLKYYGKENLTKHVGSAYAYVKNAKNRKIMIRKVATSRKNKTYDRQWKTRPISVCECLIVNFKMFY